ncbi:hypothetical protein EF914_33730 [Streptomyces sp. WAC05458]|nr:hypothetical protein EF914_33730 [Streptomyces sp. WAC05458]
MPCRVDPQGERDEQRQRGPGGGRADRPGGGGEVGQIRHGRLGGGAGGLRGGGGCRGGGGLPGGGVVGARGGRPAGPDGRLLRGCGGRLLRGRGDRVRGGRGR